MKFDIDYFNQIEGWCDTGVVDLYKSMTYTHNNAAFVEVGSWKGKSSFCMASLIDEQRKNIKFYCVDIWRSGEDDFFNIFQKNTEPVKDYINPIRLLSTEASKLFEDESLDFVFIDAAHDYENVKNDIYTWYRKVKKGGVIAGHDYHPTWPEVVKAVDEWATKNNKIINVDVTTWIHHKISSN